MATGRIYCRHCDRHFGGVTIFDRHFDRRRDVCRSNTKLRKMGFHQKADGTWVRKAPNTETAVLPGLGRKAASGGDMAVDPQPGTSGPHDAEHKREPNPARRKGASV